MKYWRTRFLLLPVKRTPLNPTVKEDKRNHHSDHMGKIEGFLRFLESVNKIRRSNNARSLFQTRVCLLVFLFFLPEREERGFETLLDHFYYFY